jgi:hypothetical protein
VQLSALMTASSLGSFLRGPCFAIDWILEPARFQTLFPQELHSLLI